MSSTFNVKLTGRFTRDINRDQVRAALTQNLKIDADKSALIMSGKSVVIKKTRDEVAAKKIAQRFERLGFEVLITANRDGSAESPSGNKTDTGALAGLSKQSISDIFQGKKVTVPTAIGYKAGVITVFAMIIMLFVVYLSLIVGTGFFAYWHATENVSIFSGSGDGIAKVLIYLTPLLCAFVLLVTLVKPLIARHGHEPQEVKLEPTRQPLLFQFIYSICDTVGARRPSAVFAINEVNASAGLKSFFAKDLVLRIGLPLVSGLNVQQLGGVLAHEFGHFAQGTAMRLNWANRYLLYWFYSAAYGRDEWDERLERWKKTDIGYLVVMVLVAQGCVWVTRWLLRGLRNLADFASKYLMRQMEFDADTYEAKVAGSDEFAKTSNEIVLMSVAFNEALQYLYHSWQDKKLVSDMPALAAHYRAEFSDEKCSAILSQSQEVETAWRDTHPDDAARIANAKAVNATAILVDRQPSTNLFQAYPALCRQASLQYYRNELGLPVATKHLIDNDAFLNQEQQRRSQEMAVNYITQGFNDTLLLSFDKNDVAATASYAEQYREAVERAKNILSEASENAETYLFGQAFWEAFYAQAESEAVHMYVGNKSLEVGAAIEEQRKLRAKTESKILRFKEIKSAILIRIGGAVAYVKQNPALLADSGYDLEENQKLLNALTEMEAARSQIIAMWFTECRLGRLLHHYQDMTQDDDARVPMEQYINALFEEAKKQLDAFRQAYAYLPYPFDHAENIAGIAHYIDADLPESDAIAQNPYAALSAMESVRENFQYIWMRLLQNLALFACFVEAKVVPETQQQE